jgi:hypothetical protein
MDCVKVSSFPAFMGIRLFVWMHLLVKGDSFKTAQISALSLHIAGMHLKGSINHQSSVAITWSRNLAQVLVAQMVRPQGNLNSRNSSL